MSQNFSFSVHCIRMRRSLYMLSINRIQYVWKKILISSIGNDSHSTLQLTCVFDQYLSGKTNRQRCGHKNGKMTKTLTFPLCYMPLSFACEPVTSLFWLYSCVDVNVFSHLFFAHFTHRGESKKDELRAIIGCFEPAIATHERICTSV